MSRKAPTTLNATQLRIAFTKLPKRQQLRLVKAFEQATWSDRFGHLVRHIRHRARKYPPMSDEEIVRMCREVRQDLYELDQARRRR